MDIAGSLPNIPPVAVFVIFLWSIILKGLALWRSSKFNQRYWFIAILILNTVGILELIYLFGFAKNKLTGEEIKQGFKSFFTK